MKDAQNTKTHNLKGVYAADTLILIIAETLTSFTFAIVGGKPNNNNKSC